MAVLVMPMVDALAAGVMYTRDPDHVMGREEEDGCLALYAVAGQGRSLVDGSLIFRSRLYIIDPTELNNSSLFAYVSEFSLTINNNITPTKAIGILGGFDINAGNFDVTGSVETYFSTVAAVQAIRDNADVSLNLILSKDNTGIVLDVPLLSISGGRTTVEIDTPVKLPLEIAGAKNSEDYTFLSTWFPYLPDAAMASN